MPRTSDRTPIANMEIRPAILSGCHGDLYAKPPRMPFAAKAATIRKVPKQVIVAASEAVMPRMIVSTSRAAAAYSAMVLTSGDLMIGYVS